MKTIIIAEDEPSLQEIYTQVLQDKGFHVLSALNGAEALDLLEKSSDPVSAILLDILMPKMDGFDALERIRGQQKFQPVKIIMLTNLDSPDDRHKAIELGADDFLVKSKHTPSQLVEQVIKIIS